MQINAFPFLLHFQTQPTSTFLVNCLGMFFFFFSASVFSAQLYKFVCVLVRFAVEFYLLRKSERFYTPVTWAAPEGRGQKEQLPPCPCPCPLPSQEKFYGDSLVPSGQSCQYVTY